MAAPSAEQRGLFARGVRAVLGGWAALQLAVAQRFGGPQSPEKAAWLVGALQDFFTQNADLREEEVEQFLAEVMDNEFDTAVEDGSLRQVSRELVTLFSRARRGDAGGVGEALGALAQRGPSLRAAVANARPAGSPALLPGSDGHLPGSAAPAFLPNPEVAANPPLEEEEEEEEAMDCGTPPPPPGPGGWTLVQRRRR